jgi:hypothetical protein
VQNVIDSVMSSLFEDKNRKFIYVEMVGALLLIFQLLVYFLFSLIFLGHDQLLVWGSIWPGILPEMVETAK